MPAHWGGVARRGARQVRVEGPGKDEMRAPGAPPPAPPRWVRDEPAPRRPREAVDGRASVELPGDVVSAVRAAVLGRTANARERLVAELRGAAEAYERGRYEEAARRVAPVAEAAPAVVAVRELAGLAHYRARRWRGAILHLRAHADMTGSASNLPALMDAERALGHPRSVRRVYDEVVAASPSPEVLSEARIVMAGSLADRGKVHDAVELLVAAGAGRNIRNPANRHVRQWYVLADLYERAGDVARARELFSRVAASDAGAYDVEERLEDLGGRLRVSTRRSPRRRAKGAE